MSADEIRKLAERCNADARRLGGCAGTADFEEDEYHYKFYKEASDAELAKASALLAYAAMVERCEATIRTFDNGFHKNDVGILNYILKGATDGTN